MNVVCNMSQRPSHGLLGSSSADWLLGWSCGQAIRAAAAAPPSETLLVVHLKCMRLRVGEGEACQRECYEIPDTAVSDAENSFLFEQICLSGRHTFSDSASMFQTFISALIWESCVSFQPELIHLIQSVLRCYGPEGCRCAVGLTQAPPCPNITAVHTDSLDPMCSLSSFILN